jgi:hypothetical protein
MRAGALMIRQVQTVFLLFAGFVATVAAASAQEPASSFDSLAGRIQVGQWIWVTDTAGREVRGRLERISNDTLVLKADGVVPMAAADVRRIRARDRDSVKNGTLVGLVVGGGMGTAWYIGAIADDSGDIDARVECAEGFTVFPALGAVGGLAIDALIPGEMRVVYQASLPQGTSRPNLLVLPLISSHMKGLVVSFSF